MRETWAPMCRLIFINICLDDVSIIASCYDSTVFPTNSYARTEIISQCLMLSSCVPNTTSIKTDESCLSSTSSFNYARACVFVFRWAYVLDSLPSKSLFLGANVLCFHLVYNERPSVKNSKYKYTKGWKLPRFATLVGCLLLIFLFTVNFLHW